MSDPIHQETSFPISPDKIYHSYMDAERHAAFTGRPAVIEEEEGAAFSAHGGVISGRNIELIPGRRIVQAWRAADWPEGVYSILRIELKEEGTGTRLELHHDGFPTSARDQLEQGWNQMYWQPLRSYLFDGS